MRYKPLVRALTHKQVRVAIVTLVVAIAAEYGLDWDAAAVSGIVGAGVAVMAVIAGRDARAKRKHQAAGKTAPTNDD